jgi:hypothetical protein
MTRLSIEYTHKHYPARYIDISSPDEPKQYISNRTDKKPSELYAEFKKLWATKSRPVYFTQKQVHAQWTLENEKVWKLDEDELVSDQIVIDRFNNNDLEKLALPEMDGIQAYAFAMKTVLSERGPFINEVGMDSTCTFMASPERNKLSVPSILQGKPMDSGLSYMPSSRKPTGSLLPCTYNPIAACAICPAIRRHWRPLGSADNHNDDTDPWRNITPAYAAA